MRIALDYDKTYSAEPRFWGLFIGMCKTHGHDVRIVTIRDERHDRTAPIAVLEQHLPVIYTRGVAKKWFCTHFTNGWMPDIWIDDKPESILENSPATPEGLVAWRAERDEPQHLPEDIDPCGR